MNLKNIRICIQPIICIGMLFGCALPYDQQKNQCATSKDCLEGYVCVDKTCVPRGWVDAGEDAGDGLKLEGDCWKKIFEANDLPLTFPNQTDCFFHSGWTCNHSIQIENTGGAEVVKNVWISVKIQHPCRKELQVTLFNLRMNFPATIFLSRETDCVPNIDIKDKELPAIAGVENEGFWLSMDTFSNSYEWTLESLSLVVEVCSQ